jgi:hypothetical protein
VVFQPITRYSSSPRPLTDRSEHPSDSAAAVALRVRDLRKN